MISPRSSAWRTSFSSVRRSDRNERMIGREKLDPVAAGLLGVGQRELRVGDEIAALGVELWVVDGGADRYGERDLALAEADRRGERRPQGVEPASPRSALSWEDRLGRIGENDDAELIARQAGQGVAGLEVARQPAGDRQQRRIAHR